MAYEDAENFFEALTDLRDGGSMNMFGAPRWLRDNYGLSREEATKVFGAWTKYLEDNDL